MKRENPDSIQGSLPHPVIVAHGKRLKLDVEASTGGAVVLHCQGRIIFGPEARTLTKVVADVLPSTRRMIVDLAGVDAIDSAGLGELVLLHMWAEAARYKLKFASPRKAVRQLLELTNLASVLETYSSVAEAMSAMWDEEVMTA